MGSLPKHSKSTKLISMRKLTATLCLTIAVLLGSEVRGSDLHECEPTTYKYETLLWDKCIGTFKEEYSNGPAVYIGEYKKGRKHGMGTETYADGDKYVGEHRNNKRHGQGTYTFANGRVMEGIWKNGEFQYAPEIHPNRYCQKNLNHLPRVLVR